MANATLGFWPVFFRLLGFILATPILPTRFFNLRTKAMLSFAISLISVPDFVAVLSLQTSVSWVQIYVTEFALGLLLGVFSGIVYWALVFAGDLWDIMSGFQMMTAIDPFTSVPQPVMTQFFSLMAAAVFVVGGGLDSFIALVIMSYRLIPAGSFIHLALSEPALFLTRVFSLGLAVAIPIVVLIILLEFIMGVVSKGASGFPVFVVWIPLQTAVALVLLFAMLPLMRVFTQNWTRWAVQYLTSLLSAG